VAEYRLLTHWYIEAPLSDVYDALLQSLRWPGWWRGLESVNETEPGRADGIGSVRRYTWKSPLSYKLNFAARATRIEPLAILEAEVSGDLVGTGLWLFSHDDGVTTVTHRWHVRSTKHWMNALAPVARSVFEKNHRAVMQNGAEGLARLLGARLIKASHTTEAPSATPAPALMLSGAVAAGVGAGIIATGIQLVLWWMFAIPLPDMLWRDARLAAAIVMGRSVLPPPATFEWSVMVMASVVHFALSICYGLVLAPVLSRLHERYALAAGALFGLLLYVVNMYGFTGMFPWFEATRDGITVAAHVAFGVSAAALYTRYLHAFKPAQEPALQDQAR
jgi:hypothetical protein